MIMDDQAIDKLCLKFGHAVTVSDDNKEQTVKTADLNPGPCEVKNELMDGTAASDDTQESCPYPVQTLPIFKKIEDLSNRVQSVRNEHEHLCNEVKSITADAFLGSEALNALQNLSAEHELMKKKYHEECELLKAKYVKECLERKRLYNEVIELKGNIRVFCRCRPMKQDEIENGSTSVIDFNSSQDNELHIICSDSSRKQFKFDHIFRPEDNQEAVFLETMPVVTSVLDGYNVCIFAYGQTGTGKTYTMEGTSENRGVNYRTLEELFKICNDSSSIIRYELLVSMLEVYNEKIRDLLVDNPNQPAKKLEIKQSSEGTQEVPGLVEAPVYSTDDVWELLKSGSQVRSVGSTNANELSSRSHCLLRVTFMGENLVNGERTRSHLWLVDLAGSERIGRIEVEGDRLKESQFINKSLSALGDVISALASKSSHIPYRNSKLTHILQSSLGGDCKALMFVQISPSAADLGETLCSLNFASRVRAVENGPARKQPDHAELFKYKQLAEKAKHDEKETKKLQDSVQSLQVRLAAREHICRNLQDKVRDLENQLAEERKTRLKQENRAVSSISTQPSALSSLIQTQRTTADKKPPLFPSKMRLPLRRITNVMPMPSPIPPNKARKSTLPAVAEAKENSERASVTAANKGKTMLKPRRGSIAVRPTLSETRQVLQPKRRASVATFRPEPNANMRTPLHGSTAKSRTDRIMGRQSFVWDPQRVWRTSRVSSPLQESRETLRGTVASVEATPLGNTTSSKFRGSPPSQPGSWKPKHPTVVALQKKHVVWSPLKLRGLKNNRKSLLSTEK